MGGTGKKRRKWQPPQQTAVGEQGPREKSDPSKGPRQAATHGHRIVQDLRQGLVSAEHQGAQGLKWLQIRQGRMGSRAILSGVGTAASRFDLAKRRWKGGQILRGLVAGDTRNPYKPRNSYKPRSQMPKFGRVWKTHQSLDKRNGPEEAEARFTVLKGAFHRPHLYSRLPKQQPNQCTFIGLLI